MHARHCAELAHAAVPPTDCHQMQSGLDSVAGDRLDGERGIPKTEARAAATWRLAPTSRSAYSAWSHVHPNHRETRSGDRISHLPGHPGHRLVSNRPLHHQVIPAMRPSSHLPIRPMDRVADMSSRDMGRHRHHRRDMADRHNHLLTAHPDMVLRHRQQDMASNRRLIPMLDTELRRVTGKHHKEHIPAEAIPTVGTGNPATGNRSRVDTRPPAGSPLRSLRKGRAVPGAGSLHCPMSSWQPIHKRATAAIARPLPGHRLSIDERRLLRHWQSAVWH